MHQQQLLKCMILVGDHNNSYILDMLRISINPLNMLLVPTKYIPELKVADGALK